MTTSSSSQQSPCPTPTPILPTLPLTPHLHPRSPHPDITIHPPHSAPTNATLNRLASTPLPSEPAAPQLNLYFKCENLQKIGAFKARGAHHALLRLQQRLGPDEVRRRGVITHSSGNHAQALALAARTLGIPACIVMPRISTPSKIAGTRLYTDNVVFSGSTSDEREEVVRKVMEETGAILVPPYDDVDVILGQGTVGLEMEEQFDRMRGEEVRAREVLEGRNRVKIKEARSKEEFEKGMDGWFGEMMKGSLKGGVGGSHTTKPVDPNPQDDTSMAAGKTRAVCSEAIFHPSSSPAPPEHTLDAIIAPLGGGGLLGGITTYFSQSPTSSTSPKPLIYGAEPSHQSANDAERGLATTPPTRIPRVSSLTIADGLRTPVGELNWEIISDPRKLTGGVFSVSDEEIKRAMRLVLERMKVVVEPSACVGLAVVLFHRGWRAKVVEMQRREGKGRTWDVGVVFSGGNTTVEAIAELFGGNRKDGEKDGLGDEEKQEGTK